MHRHVSLITDNNNLKFFEELNNILKEQKSIDMASACFNIAGFQLLKNTLSDAKKLRLLMCISPQIGKKEPDLFQLEEPWMILYSTCFALLKMKEKKSIGPCVNW